MHVRIELDLLTVQRIVAEHISEALGGKEVNPDSVTIEVKSKQNYRAEWERAQFRAVYETL